MPRFRFGGEASGKCVARRPKAASASRPWLQEAKVAVRRGAPDHSEISIRDGLTISLGDVRQHALRTARGQKVAYVVDLAYDELNV